MDPPGNLLESCSYHNVGRGEMWGGRALEIRGTGFKSCISFCSPNCFKVAYGESAKEKEGVACEAGDFCYYEAS